jgi:hypothetical protein
MVIVNGKFKDNNRGPLVSGKIYGINLFSYSSDRITSDEDFYTELGTMMIGDSNVVHLIDVHLINITSIGRLFTKLHGTDNVTVSNSILWGRDDYGSTDPAKETLSMRVDGTGTGMVSVTKSLVKNAPSASVSETSYTATNNTVNTVFPTVTVGSQGNNGTFKYTFTNLYPYTNEPSGWAWSGAETSIFANYGAKEFWLKPGSPALDKGGVPVVTVDNDNPYPSDAAAILDDLGITTGHAARTQALNQLNAALATDAAGNPRKQGSAIDMGAFELQ